MSPEIQEWSHKSRSRINNFYLLTRPIVQCVQTIQYISDLGGVFGLWFGFALLTFAELCEFITDLIVLGICQLIDALSYR